MTKNEIIFVSDIESRCVAIVKFGPSGFETDGLRPAEYYQVTIDPNHCSPSGEFIRFGVYDGDEIVGWQRCKALSVVEVLAEWPESEDKPVMTWGNSITMRA